MNSVSEQWKSLTRKTWLEIRRRRRRLRRSGRTGRRRRRKAGPGGAEVVMPVAGAASEALAPRTEASTGEGATRGRTASRAWRRSTASTARAWGTWPGTASSHRRQDEARDRLRWRLDFNLEY